MIWHFFVSEVNCFGYFSPKKRWWPDALVEFTGWLSNARYIIKQCDVYWEGKLESFWLVGTLLVVYYLMVMSSNPSKRGRYSICLPKRDGRLSWPWCWLFTCPQTLIHPSSNYLLDSHPTGGRIDDLIVVSPMLRDATQWGIKNTPKVFKS